MGQVPLLGELRNSHLNNFVNPVVQIRSPGWESLDGDTDVIIGLLSVSLNKKGYWILRIHDTTEPGLIITIYEFNSILNIY